jgi:hypothetical protein
MNEYIVTDPRTGRKVRLTGDSPPTEAELETIERHYGAAAAQVVAEHFGIGIIDQEPAGSPTKSKFWEVLPAYRLAPVNRQTRNITK